MDIELLVGLAIFLGVLTRTVLPYLRKLKEAEEKGQEIHFETKYLYTAIFAILSSVIISLQLITVIPPEMIVQPIGKLFATVFVWAFQHTTNDLYNEIVA